MYGWFQFYCLIEGLMRSVIAVEFTSWNGSSFTMLFHNYITFELLPKREEI